MYKIKEENKLKNENKTASNDAIYKNRHNA